MRQTPRGAVRDLARGGVEEGVTVVEVVVVVVVVAVVVDVCAVILAQAAHKPNMATTGTSAARRDPVSHP